MTPTTASESPAAFFEAVEGLRSALATGGNVLICGEPGAGHERLAKAIHFGTDAGGTISVDCLWREGVSGSETARPFVVVDCSRGGDVEKQLLGVVSGDTDPDESGPERIKAGSVLHAALSGTLVLRHVTDLPRRVQTRLARILRDDEVAVADHGEVATVRAGIRGIGTVEAEAHRDGVRDLQAEFLKRISNTVIDLPPLRERRQDIPGLARAFLREACTNLGIQQKEMSSHACELLAALEWRGNLDELGGTIWSLASSVPAARIRMADVLARIKFDGRTTMLFGGTLKEARARFEREYVAHVLEQHGHQMTEAAKALGIQRTNLYRKVRQLSVNRHKVSRERV